MSGKQAFRANAIVLRLVIPGIPAIPLEYRPTFYHAAHGSVNAVIALRTHALISPPENSTVITPLLGPVDEDPRPLSAAIPSENGGSASGNLRRTSALGRQANHFLNDSAAEVRQFLIPAVVQKPESILVEFQ
jgi:hypothetical protein